MKCKDISFYITFIIMLLLLSACKQSNNQIYLNEGQLLDIITEDVVEPTGSLNDVHTLTIWRYNDNIDLGDLSLFSDLDLAIITPDNYPLSYIGELGSPDAPDLMLINMDDFGLFNNTGKIYDISLQDDFYIWKSSLDYATAVEAGRSLDQRQTFGVLYQYSPLVMYYRQDLLESYHLDLKVDPAEMSMPYPMFSDWLLAASLREHFLFQWPTSPVDEWMINHAYFSEDYKSLLSDTPTRDLYKISQEVYNNNRFLGSSIWDSPGIMALTTDKLEAVYLGTYGEYYLEEIVPDQSGLWRAGYLPMNIQAMTGSMLLINKDSPHRDLLYKYLQGRVEADISTYVLNKNRTSLFLDNQTIGGLYYDMVKNWRILSYTSLDFMIKEDFIRLFNEAISYNRDFDAFQENLTDVVKMKLPYDYESLTK